MFGLGELAAVVSAIKGVQSLLNGLSDAKASYDQASQLLGHLSSAQDSLDEKEKNWKLKKPLTSKQALQIAQKQAEIDAAKQKVRDHLLMSGHGNLIRKQEALMRASKAQHEAYLKNIAVKRKQRKERNQAILTAVFLVGAFIFLTFSGFYLHKEYKEHQLKSAKERLKDAKMRQKNYRQCGRPRC